MTRLLIALSLAVSACGGVTDGKPGSGNGRLEDCPECNDPNPGSPPSNPSPPAPNPAPAPTSDPTPPATPAGQGFAIFERDMPPYSSGGSGGTGGAGGAGLDPATLHLVIGTSGASCADPRQISDCEEWTVRLPLSPDLQHTGPIALSRLNGFMSSGGERRSPNPYDCGMGGGSFSQGWLTILSIDDRRVRFTLSDTWTFDFDANGTYEVERCPTR